MARIRTPAGVFHTQPGGGQPEGWRVPLADQVRPALTTQMPVYVSPAGYKRILDEYQWLLKTERPRITAEVAYAASLGDRSENAEYIYGKKRLREIDGRLRFLQHRIERFEVVDSSTFTGNTVRFGARVSFEDEEGVSQTWTILGEDEVDTEAHVISHVSPLGKALIGHSVDETVGFETPKGRREITITRVEFPR